MKTTLLSLFLTAISTLTATAQSFIDTTKTWYIEDCCYGLGEWNCTTYPVNFGQPQMIDDQEYYPLSTPYMPSFIELTDRYYRESSGQVFMRTSDDTTEYLMYDFNLQVGEQLNLGTSIDPFLIQALAVDSIELSNGEKRKRIQVARAFNINYNTYWVEGAGSLSSTFNMMYMFNFDCWSNLSCYRQDSTILYAPGNCTLTSTSQAPEPTFSVYPNPASDQLMLQPEKDQNIVSLRIFNWQGALLLQQADTNLQHCDVSDLSPGSYLLAATFDNHKTTTLKFIKN